MRIDSAPALPGDVLTAAHPLFTSGAVTYALSPERSVARRLVDGGTAPGPLRAQVAAARAAIGPQPEVTRGNEIGLRVS